MLKFKKNTWVFKMHSSNQWGGWEYRSVKLSDIANAKVGDLMEGGDFDLKVTYKSNKFIEFDVLDGYGNIKGGFCFNLKRLMVEWYTTISPILWSDFLHDNIPQMQLCNDLEWRY